MLSVNVLDGRKLKQRIRDLCGARRPQRQLAEWLHLTDADISDAVRGAPISAETTYQILLGLEQLERRGRK